MFTAHSPLSRARASYQAVDLTGRIGGASPHQLIGIMFDELLKSLDAMTVAAGRRDYARLASGQARALSIIGGLEASLDMERGGDLARNLASVYREAHRLTLTAGRESRGELAQQARSMIAEIASAWEAIGSAG
jgi:flagellar protein FliS